MPLDPLQGTQDQVDQVHGVFPDQDQAMSIAETLYEEYCSKMEALEEKKGAVTGKISSAIDSLEKKRKEHVDMAKADPKNASQHKDKIAMIATKIDDLMNKLEKVERSKKAKEEKDEKKVVKESINEADEPGSPERLMLTIKTPLMALINAAKKAVEQSGEEPYLSNKETDNAADNLALLVNLCYMFLPEKSNNLRDVRAIKLALAKAANQKMGTPPAIPSKAPTVPNVTGKSNLGGKPPLPPLPNKK
jgi:chromosome segregation ATPase